MSEGAEQAAVFEWAAYFDELRWMHAIPNGTFLAGDRVQRAKQMARLKAQGLKPGVSDIFLPLARRGFHGLYIEMKRAPHQGPAKPTRAQLDFARAVEAQGYAFFVCRGAEEAIEKIRWYAGI